MGGKQEGHGEYPGPVLLAKENSMYLCKRSEFLISLFLQMKQILHEILLIDRTLSQTDLKLNNLNLFSPF